MTRRTHVDMADELEKLCFSKRTWLEQFGSGKAARPEHEVEVKARELEVLEQARDDYRRAAARRA